MAQNIRVNNPRRRPWQRARSYYSCYQTSVLSIKRNRNNWRGCAKYELLHQGMHPNIISLCWTKSWQWQKVTFVDTADITSPETSFSGPFTARTDTFIFRRLKALSSRCHGRDCTILAVPCTSAKLGCSSRTYDNPICSAIILRTVYGSKMLRETRHPPHSTEHQVL